ncbi:MAG: response regulator [Thermodesulfobacteriota bacterium]
MKVLVADDEITSLEILDAVVTKSGYEAVRANNGYSALETLKSENRPRLAVLDWVMPGLDGLEVCKRIKKDYPAVYIILITSKWDKDAISTALSEGADDFLSKPFDRLELQSRLEVGKRVVSLYSELAAANTELEKYAEEMESLAEEKASQLVHAERLSSLGLLTAGVAHEINNPTTFICTNLSDFEKFWPIADNYLRTCSKDNPDDKKLSFIIRAMPDVIQGIRKGAQRIRTIVNGLKTFSRTDRSEKTVFDIHEKINEALMLCSNVLKYKIDVEKDFEEKQLFLEGDEQKIVQVFVNLFTNAADAMENQKKGKLWIKTEEVGDNIKIRVSDTGPGLSENQRKKIWDPFFTTKAVGKGTGLGLAISHGIITDHKGNIDACNSTSGGADFCISLPVLKSE